MLGLGLSLTKNNPSVSPVETLIASYDFNSDTGTGASANTIPTGWEKSDSGNFTLYGSTTDTDLLGNQNTQAWIFDEGTTGSVNTGPGGGHAAGPDTIDNIIDPSSGAFDGVSRFLYYEASSASSGTQTYRNVIRTEELDFSGYSSITMTFWFHAYGSALGSSVGAAVAVTTDAQSCSSAVEAGSGLGLTSDVAGGATITYEDLGGTSHSVVRIGDGGQVQTSGHTDAANPATNYWIKASCDLSAAAGQSSVYVHFAMITKQAPSFAYTQDIAIDSVSIKGS